MRSQFGAPTAKRSTARSARTGSGTRSCACIAFAAIGTGGVLLETTHVALLAVGGATLGALLISIYNAWDSVSHIVVSRRAHGENDIADDEQQL